MRTLPWILWPFLLSASAPVAAPVLPTPQGEGAEDAQLVEFTTLESELQAATDDLAARIQAAELVRDRGKLRRERKALPAEYFQRFFALAEAGNPHALLWSIQNADASGRDRDAVPQFKVELYERAIRLHGSASGFLPFFDALIKERKVFGVPVIERVAGEAFKASDSSDVRARILFGLGQLLARSKVPEESERGLAYLEELDREYAESTWAERAAGDLFELKRLQTGMEVPDIVAADLDGVEFKLSDYRGKVVMVDFWGDW